MKTETALKGILTFLALCLVAVIVHSTIKSMRCADFHAQHDAQILYSLGAQQLDGYDKDGRACEGISIP